MGEIAEMMLDGTMCAGCGEFLGTDAGYPIYCSGCGGDGEDENGPFADPLPRRKKAKYVCSAPKVWGCTGCPKHFRKKSHAEDHCAAKGEGHGQPIDTSAKVKP